MDGCRKRVIETVTVPDLIQAGDAGELLAVRLYDKTTLGRKYILWLPTAKPARRMVLS